MEFWVVAAATGAGYVAKHWQNLSGEKESSSKLSPILSPRVQLYACQLFDKMPNSVFPLPKLSRTCLLDGDIPSPEEEHEYFDDSGHRLHEFRTKNSKRKSFSSLRPLAVTGNKRDVIDVKDHKIVFMEENGASMEAEFLEPIGSVKLPRRPEQMNVKRFEIKDLHPQGNDMVSLFLGITIGILSTSLTNQHEDERLNDLLEQAECMVQDLHNKLEIKDGFTKKEHDTKADGTTTNSPKADKFELTSDIEAELEAELERLEENMKGCTLQSLSNVIEIDSDFEADMARGDLNLDALTWQLDSQSESGHGDNKVKTVKSQSTEKPVFTPNYAVSSLDLRLRLHEVIESELRSRIEELEAILHNQNSQTKPNFTEPQEENSFWDYDHTRIESSSSTP